MWSLNGYPFKGNLDRDLPAAGVHADDVAAEVRERLAQSPMSGNSQGNGTTIPERTTLRADFPRPTPLPAKL